MRVLFSIDRCCHHPVANCAGPVGVRALSIRDFPGRLAGHAAGRVWQRCKAFVCDLAAAILANTVSALGDSVAGVLFLLALLLEDLLDGLAIRSLALHLREIGFPKSLAHETFSIHLGGLLKRGATVRIRSGGLFLSM